MAENTIDIAGASQDLQTIEDFVNLPAGSDVRPRLLPSVNVGTLAGARQAIFEAGGLPATPFATKALMTASALVDGDYAMVTDDTDNNGLYVKTAGAWVKSGYDQLTQAKEYTDGKLQAHESEILNRSKNLFNAATSTKGKVIAANTGNITDNASYSISDFIAVEPNTDYTISGGDLAVGKQPFINTVYYDADKNFITRKDSSITSGSSYTFTVPPTVSYIRFNMNGGDADDLSRMLNKGSSALPYEPHYLKIKDSLISDNYLKNYEILTPSVNLFDARKATEGKVIALNGSVSDNNLYSISDYIAVEPSATYTASKIEGIATVHTPFTHIAYYDANKLFIRRDFAQAVDGDNSVIQFTSPVDAAYIRLNMNGGAPTELERMLVKGDIPQEYEYHRPKLAGVGVGKSQLDFIQSPRYNLLRDEDIERKKAIASNGALVDRDDYSTSGFIKINANNVYTVSGGVKHPLLPVQPFIVFAYYNADKVFISRAYATETPPFTIVAPAGAEYLRVAMNGGDPLEHQRMLVEGDVLLDYESPLQQIDGVSLSAEATEQVYQQMRLDLSQQYITDVPTNIVLDTANATWSEQYQNWKAISSADVNAMWDTLLTKYPEYATKQFLGSDAWGNPISLFNLKPTTVQSNNPRKLPKIFLTLGIHGLEKVAPLAVFLLIEQMMENWKNGVGLDALMFNCELLIIPMLNPSGWDDNSRKNRNGVDLNRNFDSGWTLHPDPTDKIYGGASPFSELETQYVKQVFEDNSDIDAFYDYHNFGGEIQPFKPYIWIPAANVQTEFLAQAYIERMTRKFSKSYDWIPSYPYKIGYSEVYPNTGMACNYAVKIGIPYAATFECCEVWHIQPSAIMFDDTHVRTAVESIGNWLLMTVNALATKIIKTP